MFKSKILYFLLIVAVVVIPLDTVTAITTGFTVFKLVIVVISIIVLTQSLKSRLSYPSNFSFKLFTFYILLSTLSSFFLVTEHPIVILLLTSQIFYYIFIIIVFNIRIDTKSMLSILKIFIISTTLIYAYLAIVGIDNFIDPVYRRLSFGDENENVLAFSMGFTLLSILYFLVKAPSSKSKILYLSLFVFNVYFFILLGSRTAIVSILVAVLFIVIRNLSLKNFIYLVLFSGILFLITQTTIFGDRISGIIEIRKENTEKSTLAGRDIIWDNYLEKYRSSPIFGLGYGYTYLRVKGDYVSHNDFVKVLVELGLIGIVIFVLFIIMLFYETSKIFENEFSFLFQTFFLFSVVFMVGNNVLGMKFFYVWLALFYNFYQFENSLYNKLVKSGRV